MKVLIVSDIHGNYDNMKKVLDNTPSFDFLILLGDILSGPDIEGYNPDLLAELLNNYTSKIYYVTGNCDLFRMNLLDFYIDHDYLIVPIDHHLFFLTHGHLYSPYEYPDISFDVFLSGHTHKPMMEEKKGKLFLNPGSITLPRGNSSKSYMIYEDGNFSLIDLEKNRIIQKMCMK